MSDPFLTLPGARRKRAPNPERRNGFSRTSKKIPANRGHKRRLPGDPQSEDDDDEVGANGMDDSDIDMSDREESEEQESDRDETPAEKRLRLAKQYLDTVRTEIEGEIDAAEVDRDIISQRLQKDVAESKGKVYKHIAASLSVHSIGKPIHHKNPVTCVAQNRTFIYTGTKNGVVEKWNIEHIARPVKLNHINRERNKMVLSGHLDDIISMALSGDGKVLATGGSDKRICIWDTSTMTHLKTFTQHRGAIMGLACRLSTNQLYSTSSDRTLKLWSMNDLAYIETLFGHQDSIPNVASFSSERCVSVGARDRSARVWKIIDETQLVYQITNESQLKDKSRQSANTTESLEIIPEGSMDCVAVIDEQHFVTGSDNGDIILWSLNKKKPQFVYKFGHGLDPPPSPNQHSAESVPEEVNVPPQPRWITCLSSLPYTDLFLSGSWDGKLGMWRVSEDLRRFELLQYIDLGVKGVINGISVDEMGKRAVDGVRVVLAVGAESRLGRWKIIKGGKNCAMIVTLGIS